MAADAGDGDRPKDDPEGGKPEDNENKHGNPKTEEPIPTFSRLAPIYYWTLQSLAWLWIAVQYFFVGGFVMMTIGAFQFQDSLSEEFSDRKVLAKARAELSIFRERYMQGKEALDEQRDLLSAAAETLVPSTKLEIEYFLAHCQYWNRLDPGFIAHMSVKAARCEDFSFLDDTGTSATSNGKPPNESYALSQVRLLLRGLSNTQKFISENLVTRQLITQNQGGQGSQALTEKHLRDLLYLQKLDWMVPLGPEPIRLATMPPGLLTFVITLAMGALGSLLYVTQFCLKSVIDGQTNKDQRLVRSFLWFLFRPLLGIMTALVVFIFVKAGQFSFGDASITSNLNPYLISFLAIISGFLSWQAIEAIQRTGYKFFGWQSKKDRWAYGLKDRLGKGPDGKALSNDQVVDARDKLAKALKVSDDQLGKWLGEEEQVNHRIQAKILTILGGEPRELFSDIHKDGLATSP